MFTFVAGAAVGQVGQDQGRGGDPGRIQIEDQGQVEKEGQDPGQVGEGGTVRGQLQGGEDLALDLTEEGLEGGLGQILIARGQGPDLGKDLDLDLQRKDPGQGHIREGQDLDQIGRGLGQDQVGRGQSQGQKKDPDQLPIESQDLNPTLAGSQDQSLLRKGQTRRDLNLGIRNHCLDLSLTRESLDRFRGQRRTSQGQFPNLLLSLNHHLNPKTASLNRHPGPKTASQGPHPGPKTASLDQHPLLRRTVLYHDQERINPDQFQGQKKASLGQNHHHKRKIDRGRDHKKKGQGQNRKKRGQVRWVRRTRRAKKRRGRGKRRRAVTRSQRRLRKVERVLLLRRTPWRMEICDAAIINMLYYVF